MGNGQNPGQNAFLGLTNEQLIKIVYEEFSKSGFQFNNFNATLPSIISRILMQNSAVAGSYLNQMFVSGILGNFFKKQ